MNAPDAALNAAISPPSEDGFFRPDPALSERIVQATGRPARVVPAELVALFDVALPIRGQRARRAALAFAVEDMIGQPLDAVHVAYCRKSAVPGNVLAAVVDRKVMDLAKGDAPVLPEAFAIPAPEASPIGPAWAASVSPSVRFSCRAPRRISACG